MHSPYTLDINYKAGEINRLLTWPWFIGFCKYYIATYTCYGYTMDTSGLPDMYSRSLRAAGLRVEGVHIRETTSGHGITVVCHSHSFWYAESSSFCITTP